jgi:hypothetical protein
VPPRIENVAPNRLFVDLTHASKCPHEPQTATGGDSQKEALHPCNIP